MFGKIIASFDKALTSFEDWTLFISVMAALISMFFNVVLRYGFNYSLAWSEELVRLVIIYTTLIGCASAVKNRAMIKIDALVHLMPILAVPLTYFSNVVTLMFSVMMMYYGYQMAEMQARTLQKTIIMEIPLVIPYAVLPLMGVLMFIRTIQVIHQDSRELIKKKKAASADSPDCNS